MSNSNSAQALNKPKFSVAITTPNYRKLINNTLGDPERAKRFIATITSAVAVNPALQDCDAGTILAGALLGESLNLSPSPQLGQFYLVPFKSKAKYDKSGNLIAPECTKATFVLGYKGYKQLAQRSGQLKKFNAMEIKEGELISYDPFNEDIKLKYIEDEDEREASPTIGYYAYFELLNGFKKILYWSKKKMLSHADKYSPAFSKSAYEKIQNGEIPDKDMWKYSSFWYSDFDGMAVKTMTRQLISKGGCPMSTEMMSAFEKDDKVISVDDGNYVALDAEPTTDPATLITPEASSVVEQVDLSDLDD